MGEVRQASRARLIIAFAAVYLVWGSTYLAIRVGVRTIPPLLMAGVRFLIAGALLYGLARLRGGRRPSARQWWGSAAVGAGLLLGGNGGVVLAERVVPSGVAALLVATVPVWMVLLDWLWGRGRRPGPRLVLGLALGLLGIVVLVGPGSLGAGGVNLGGAAILLVASLSWAVGSILGRELDLPRDATLATGTEMLCGGGLLVLAGLAHGELGALHPSAISGASALAFAYLVLIGSLIGFTAYVWLLGHTTAARAATYAYVNPVVAVLLGWAILGEALTPRMFAAAAVIVAGVVLITLERARSSARRQSEATEPAEEAA